MPNGRQSARGTLSRRSQYQKDRRKFAFRVYLLATIFVLVSLAQWLLVMLLTDAPKLFRDHQYADFIVVLCLFVALFTVSAFVFCEPLRQWFPFNWLLALLIVECITLGMMRVSVESKFLYFACGIGTVTLAFSILIATGIFLRYDLTLHVVVLFACTILFFVGAVFFSILAVLTDLHFSMMIYAALLAVIVSMFTMYHAQTIRGGRYAEMRIKDILLGALIIYHDFVILFVLALVIMKSMLGDESPHHQDN